MVRRFLPLLLLLLPLPLVAQDGGRSLHWPAVEVAAHLDEEGRLHVRERQTMVMTGDWNGGERSFDIRHGQKLKLHSIHRIDPASGISTPLTEGDAEEVDGYTWVNGETVRWRSRLESDPPFQRDTLTYELAYTLWPVLIPGDDDGYSLRHDFAFADRAGIIERYQVDLTADSAWATPFGNHIRETAENLPPGRGYTITLPLTYVGAGAPLVAPPAAPAPVRAAVAAGALLVPLLLWVGLRRRDRHLDEVAPLTPTDAIDETWLRETLFFLPAEVVGTAWDRGVGQAEVTALLARLVAEGKLSSRVEMEEDEPVLHLRREVPLEQFSPHEQQLLEGLLLAEEESTSTRAVQEHYKKSGFDPSGLIRRPLQAALTELPGSDGLARRWQPAAALLLLGIALAVVVPDNPGRAPLVAIGVGVIGVISLLAVPFAVLLSRRVTARAGLEVAIILAVLAAALPLLLLTAVAEPTRGPFLFYRPGSGLLVSFFILLTGLGLLTYRLTQPTESIDRLAYRRRLVSARRYFADELAQAQPRLRDAWFPYLLAFGLADQVDQWSRDFGARTRHRAGASTLGTAHGGDGGGWSGGGPQFGGGSFGGGGAGGAWGVAAAGMAAGVSAPSSTGGGGGGASFSGGGGGGGW